MNSIYCYPESWKLAQLTMKMQLSSLKKLEAKGLEEFIEKNKKEKLSWMLKK